MLSPLAGTEESLEVLLGLVDERLSGSRVMVMVAKLSPWKSDTDALQQPPQLLGGARMVITSVCICMSRGVCTKPVCVLQSKQEPSFIKRLLMTVRRFSCADKTVACPNGLDPPDPYTTFNPVVGRSSSLE